ncbi:26S proteasome non-ATPase regulatory subunit 5 [Syncephalis pseudoplumigaleata]|uniref:26S proteasome non-ATPase regulatory subunit 5 n=1 Tax=Syncephalis pseudoplumigaleata TaxID=1712513 RepID=A0A4V1J241_9FUNG|nr:26S proteasome non-ATPase regulatory subunit 5 [Syncephalis pseudoplumigaleata]|eukprot:RKP27239.1 26S proteasome non-ATPase regulatory subunit 5 [Syncephalis pseudoplumigaleata]
MAVSTDTTGLLFSLLSFEDSYVVELSCSCIALVLAKEDYNEIADAYEDYLVAGLQMPIERVRMLALSQIVKCLAANETVHRFVCHAAWNEAAHAYCAALSSVQLSDYIDGAKAFFRPTAKPVLVELSEKNEIVRSRLWDLLVPMCCKYRFIFDAFEASGLLKHMIGDISSKDPLLVMNTVHLIASLADTDYAMAFLDDEGIIRSITGWALADEDTAGDRLITCSALKFLGRVGETHDVRELNEKFAILDAVQRQLTSSDAIVKAGDWKEEDACIHTVAIRTLGMLGRSASGAAAMQQHGVLGPFIELVVRAMGELRVPCLESVMMLLEIRGEKDAMKTGPCQQFYHDLDAATRPQHAGFLAILVANTKQAFDDLRYVSYAVIQALTEHRWGRESIAASSHAMNHLLSRDVEPSYEGKKWKYSIIRHLASAPDAEQFFDATMLHRLKEYLRQGAYYSPSNVSVAMESSTKWGIGPWDALPPIYITATNQSNKQ